MRQQALFPIRFNFQRHQGLPQAALPACFFKSPDKIMRRAFSLAIQISHRRGPQWRRASLFARRCVSGLLVRGRAESGNFSWLYRQLEQHPDFWMPPMKELHYLDNLNRTRRFHPPRSRDGCDASFVESMENLRARFYLDLESYGQLFQHKGHLLSGDISPAYSTLNDEIIERVLDHFPNLKVVFLARDPVERAWSQLSMGVRLGMINKFDVTDPEEVVTIC
jgi:hypothetical protein